MDQLGQERVRDERFVQVRADEGADLPQVGQLGGGDGGRSIARLRFLLSWEGKTGLEKYLGCCALLQARKKKGKIQSVRSGKVSSFPSPTHTHLRGRQRESQLLPLSVARHLLLGTEGRRRACCPRRGGRQVAAHHGGLLQVTRKVRARGSQGSLHVFPLKAFFV